MTKEKFDELLSPLLSRTALIMKNVLMDADLAWEDIDKIVLVGGSTRVPAVSDLIERTTGIKPSKDVNPDEVVALGAAIQGSLLQVDNEGSNNAEEFKPKTRVVDVNSHSLGMLLVDHNTGRDINQKMIVRNTPIPTSKEAVFYTVDEGQTSLRVQVTEGEDSDPDFVKIIGESILDFKRTKTTRIPSSFHFYI